ncbi:MAG: DUF3047 domain-containing protein [Betaproteobacteria bacterium]|nr:DUF3047 domain-containing protein [Betaproteobacteria bacterium]MDH4326017.1 DUF3047 domain-containing protein [Betaproteobacteria bacterium]MDH5577959.1 DUF3047 domain-containing protein [Betaproteobacteria bacterium]
MRAAAALGVLLALAGCAIVPEDDGLLASTPIVRALDREEADIVEVARFSRLRAGAPLPAEWVGWGLNSGKRRTDYRLVNGADRTVLQAEADGAATGLYRRIRIDPRRQPLLEWSWRIDELMAGTDKRVAAREDSVARMVVSFHGDPQKLDFQQRAQLRLAKVFAGEPLPYAMLIYVWSNNIPVETALPSPQIERIRMIVVERGAARLGEWLHYRRNIVQDYRRAFGEDPGDIVAVGVLTDSDNTQQSARALYGDITLRAP